MLKDMLKHKWAQQKACERVAAPWGEIPAVAAGPGAGVARWQGRGVPWAVPRTGCSGAWGWWAESIPSTGVGEWQAQPRAPPGCSFSMPRCRWSEKERPSSLRLQGWQDAVCPPRHGTPQQGSLPLLLEGTSEASSPEQLRVGSGGSPAAPGRARCQADTGAA